MEYDGWYVQYEMKHQLISSLRSSVQTKRSHGQRMSINDKSEKGDVSFTYRTRPSGSVGNEHLI
jgi:hypothetical protein